MFSAPLEVFRKILCKKIIWVTKSYEEFICLFFGLFCFVFSTQCFSVIETCQMIWIANQKYWFLLIFIMSSFPAKKHIRFLKSVILSRAVPKNWKRIDDFLVKLYIKSVAEMKRIYIQIDITTQWGPGLTNIINQKEIVALQKKNMFQHIQFLNHQELSQDKQIWWFSIKKIIIFEIIYIVWPTPYIHKGGLEVFKNGHNRKG